MATDNPATYPGGPSVSQDIHLVPGTHPRATWSDLIDLGESTWAVRLTIDCSPHGTFVSTYYGTRAQIKGLREQGAKP